MHIMYRYINIHRYDEIMIMIVIVTDEFLIRNKINDVNKILINYILTKIHKVMFKVHKLISFLSLIDF